MARSRTRSTFMSRRDGPRKRFLAPLSRRIVERNVVVKRRRVATFRLVKDARNKALSYSYLS